SMFMCFTELLWDLASNDFKKSGQLIRIGLLPMLVPLESGMDELGLGKVPDSPIYTTMSPESVARAVEACASLDLLAMKKEITENSEYDLDDFEPEEIASLLDDVVKALQ